ncbi:MAG: hypothetical protein DRJ55_01465 [Thermoprotei archaeon]|nr:MAG: hypothetical protein DRJ55_01465 [Thermoprotei archaeon]HDJ97544.1 hypothetical protein [Thermofilum sp.]
MEEGLLALFAGIIEEIAKLIPSILTAVAVLVIGYIVGKVTSKVVVEIARMVKLDESFEKSMVGEQFRRAGYPLSRMLSIVTRLVIYTLTILAALSFLNIPYFEEVSVSIALYLPRLAAAIVVFLFGTILIEWLSNMFEGIVLEESVPENIKTILGAGFRFFFYIFLIFIVFEVAEIAPAVTASIAQAVFLTVALSIALSLVLIVGWGLKDEALFIISREGELIKTGMYVEVGGIKGTIVGVTSFMVQIRDEEGNVHVVPKRMFFKSGFKILKKET